MQVLTSALKHLRIPALALLGTAIVLPVCIFLQPANRSTFFLADAAPDPVKNTRFDPQGPVRSTFDEMSDSREAISRAVHNSKAEVDASIARIQTEVSGLRKHTNLPERHWAHSFAGTYGFEASPGPWSSIAIAPTAGIAFMRGGCFGLEDCNCGSIIDTFDSDHDQKIDGVIVEWKHRSWNRQPGAPEKFYFILWPGTYGIADLKYLVSESDMSRLVDDFNRGGWHRNLIAFEVMTEPGQVQLSESDSFKSVRAGIPKLPAQWDAMLLKTPLLATITAISPDGSLTFDKGRVDNVFIGMEFALTSDYNSGKVKIIALEDHSARGTFIPDYNSPNPTVGLKVLLALGID